MFKKNYIKSSLLILVLLLITSCNFNHIYENREEDKKEAEKITQKFYSLIKANRKEEILKLFSAKFFKATSKDKLIGMIDWTNKEAGSSSNYSLYEWETSVVKGTNSKAEYLLSYYVKRDKINTFEIFSLQKETDSIKIIGYEINLDVDKNKIIK
ncbi:hypothetical protein ACNFU2_20590 [Chryseobacterium sp. PTM-20240506]|uniref:hypothetical protein n=1 Tax=unclassified Chryseobacterium TaxID=2593645 RepID=UPI002359FA00|nr:MULTISPECIES: hypothetical protein [unclassified Chryseobacterium]MDC8102987.1 hypothetical protein [Chryseobacterium sp. B21-037]MDQ1802535.1 hypothetical protein [Chryseobacterium sp. CKR4-1]